MIGSNAAWFGPGCHFFAGKPWLASLIVWLGFAWFAVQAQETFERFSENHRLGQNPATAILEDRQGLLWFGTEDGLLRYDGYDLTTFRHEPKDIHSLSDTFVSALYQDPAGNIWIGTYDGLNRMDHQTGTITRVELGTEGADGLNHDVIQAICQDRRGQLWIGTRGGGLDRLDPKTGRVVHLHNSPDSEIDLGSNQIRGLALDRGGRIWIASVGGGLLLHDPAKGTWKRFRHDPKDPASLSDDRVMSIFLDRAGRAWIGTNGGGMCLFDEKSGRFRWYKHDPKNPRSISHNTVKAICEDARGWLWIATEGGLNRFDPRSGLFESYRNSISDPGSLSHDYLLSVLADRSGNLWIGAFNGINRLELARKPFHAYRQKNEPGYLSSDAVWSVYPDRGGALWVGTDGGGLNRQDPATGRFSNWMNDAADPGSLSDNAVQCILEDRGGALWLGTYDGLCRMDRRKERFVRYMADGPQARGLSDNRVYALCEDPAGRLWVGTHRGVDRLDPAGDRLVAGLEPSRVSPGLDTLPVFVIVPDGPDALWVGTSGEGLIRYRTGTGEVRRFRNDPRDPASLCDDDIFSIHPDHSGRIWLATGGGLDRFDPASGKFKHFTEDEGLPSEVVLQILEDDAGQLWLSTFKGIGRLDPAKGRIRTYDRGDGLPADDFVQGASCQDARGTLYFGSTRGLVYFNPREIRDNPYVPPVILTSFKLFNKEYDLGRKASEVQEIHLDYRQNFFSFEFAALNYLAPEKNQYAYRMEGFDKGWIQAGNRRYAAFTNLDPGEYVFRVRASNSDGVWNMNGLAVRVVVAPPFWQTGWFRVLALVMLVVMSNLLFFLLKKTTTLIVYWRKTHYISHYRILKKLGRGGMGTVYKVQDLTTKQIYALKVLNEEVLEDESAKQRFIEESSIGERIDHPCVIRIIEKGEIEGNLYFTMDYYDGQTLREILAGHRLGVQASLRLVRTLFEILHEIHQQGVIHRDIKPGNIMIGCRIDPSRLAGGQVDAASLRENLRILDFGIARMIDTKTRTQTGMFVGSLYYMPPEYLNGKKARDFRGDHYALGAILYELLTGRTPYQGEDFAGLLSSIVHTRPAPPADLAGVSPAVSDFTLRLIDADESSRLSDYDRIMGELDLLLGPRSSL
jgi:ligand-binding sensor domain-containing protein/tRNA A-37 threonylcarbamoyl transferase component Bud32